MVNPARFGLKRAKPESFRVEYFGARNTETVALRAAWLRCGCCCFPRTESTVDPLLLIIFALIALSGGGVTTAVVAQNRRRARTHLRGALLEKRAHLGGEFSIFDVFWDLGVSDFALEMMAHQGLLFDDPEGFKAAHFHLDDLIKAHGSYAELLEDNLASIQEFYREHRETGPRRRIAIFRTQGPKLLPIQPARAPVPVVPEHVRPGAEGALVRQETAGRDLTLLPPDDRVLFQSTVEPNLPTLRESEEQVEIDVDAASHFGPQQMLKSIFDGRFSDTVQKWWSFRHLRATKSRLDDELEKLYDFYATDASKRPGFFEMLYDIPKRWYLEAERIAALRQKTDWTQMGFPEASQMLMEQAEGVARELMSHAQLNVDATIERIHAAARQGDRAMAGYFLYMNRHAFFAGRAPEYGAYAQRIERQIHNVQHELRKLNRAGEL